MELPIKVEGIIYRMNCGDVKILLLKRVKKDGGFWQPVTGTVNDGEKIKACLIREIKEESGIKSYIKIIDDIYFFEWKNSKNETRIEYVFGVEVENDVKIKLSEEHDNYAWCSFEDAFNKLEKENNKKALKMLRKKVKGI